MKPVPSLLLVLALSLVGNLAQWHLYAKQVARTAIAEDRQANATGVATVCSASVETLDTTAKDRAAAAKPKIAAARQATVAAGVAAQQLLTSPPAVPGDDCASAQASVDAWLQSREVHK